MTARIHWNRKTVFGQYKNYVKLKYIKTFKRNLALPNNPTA